MQIEAAPFFVSSVIHSKSALSLLTFHDQSENRVDARRVTWPETLQPLHDVAIEPRCDQPAGRALCQRQLLFRQLRNVAKVNAGIVTSVLPGLYFT